METSLKRCPRQTANRAPIGRPRSGGALQQAWHDIPGYLEAGRHPSSSPVSPFLSQRLHLPKPSQSKSVKTVEATGARATGGKRWLPNPAAKGHGSSMSGVSAKQIKRREGDARMASLEIAGRSPADARAQQTRVSLVGDGRRWRITNLQKAVRVMASWR